MIRESVREALADYGENVAEQIATIAPSSDSILTSEMIAFLALCKSRNVHLVVESGRGSGYSTRCLAAMKMQGTSIDLTGEHDRKIHNLVRGIKLEVADGFKRVPEVINRLRGRDVALLLDGPIGARAIHLADVVLEATVFIGIHDLPKVRWCGRTQQNPERIAFEKRFPSAWVSDDESVMGPWRAKDAHSVLASGHSSWEALTEFKCGMGFIAGGLWMEDDE